MFISGPRSVWRHGCVSITMKPPQRHCRHCPQRPESHIQRPWAPMETLDSSTWLLELQGTFWSWSSTLLSKPSLLSSGCALFSRSSVSWKHWLWACTYNVQNHVWQARVQRGCFRAPHMSLDNLFFKWKRQSYKRMSVDKVKWIGKDRFVLCLPLQRPLANVTDAGGGQAWGRSNSSWLLFLPVVARCVRGRLGTTLWFRFFNSKYPSRVITMKNTNRVMITC